jgi:hypothetical protein
VTANFFLPAQTSRGLSGSSLESICYADTIGGQPLRPDERGYYDVVEL